MIEIMVTKKNPAKKVASASKKTKKSLKKAQPDYLIPCHCTGWKAVNRIIETMPEEFIQSSAGTTFKFGS